MEPLTLEETWQKCLELWKFIADEKRAGNKDSVERLKCLWFKNQGLSDSDYENAPVALCYFCDFNNHQDTVGCYSCPGALVDETFTCENNRGYNYIEEPIAFYERLVELNRIRLRQQ